MLQQPTPPQLQTQNFGQTSASMIPARVPVAQGQVSAPGTTKDPHSHKKAIYGFGIAELVMGGLSFLLTIIPLSITERELEWYWRNYQYSRWSIYTGFTYASPGIWGGIFVIVTGILAVRLKSNPSRSMYVANMILAIITACATLSSSVVSGLAAGLSNHYSSLLAAIHVIITLLNFISMIVTIIHACFCCRGVCCNNRSRPAQRVVYVPTQPNMIYPQQTQYVQGPNGQVMPVYLQQFPAQQYPQQQFPAQQYPQQQFPAQRYPQSSASNMVGNTGYQPNNMTAQTAQPPTYDNVNQPAVQIETKPTGALNG